MVGERLNFIQRGDSDAFKTGSCLKTDAHQILVFFLINSMKSTFFIVPLLPAFL